MTLITLTLSTIYYTLTENDFSFQFESQFMHLIYFYASLKFPQVKRRCCCCFNSTESDFYIPLEGNAERKIAED